MRGSYCLEMSEVETKQKIFAAHYLNFLFAINIIFLFAINIIFFITYIQFEDSIILQTKTQT